MSKRTREQHEGLLRRLNELGCPVEPNHDPKPYGLEIEKIPGLTLNKIFDLESGGTGCVIEFLLRNLLTRPIFIRGVAVDVPWARFSRRSLLPAPHKTSPIYGNYQFAGGDYFDAECVLNRFFARSRSRLDPGDELHGVLLATDERPIPNEYPHLGAIWVELSIFDSRGNTFSERFGLRVDRSALPRRERQQTKTFVAEAKL